MLSYDDSGLPTDFGFFVLEVHPATSLYLRMLIRIDLIQGRRLIMKGGLLQY